MSISLSREYVISSGPQTLVCIRLLQRFGRTQIQGPPSVSDSVGLEWRPNHLHFLMSFQVMLILSV